MSWPDAVSDEDLALLNTGLPGTVGHQNDASLIHELNELCKKHGYDRVPQLTAWIEEIWRDQPGTWEKFEELQKVFMRQAEETRKYYEEQRRNKS